MRSIDWNRWNEEKEKFNDDARKAALSLISAYGGMIISFFILFLFFCCAISSTTKTKKRRSKTEKADNEKLLLSTIRQLLLQWIFYICMLFLKPPAHKQTNNPLFSYVLWQILHLPHNWWPGGPKGRADSTTQRKSYVFILPIACYFFYTCTLLLPKSTSMSYPSGTNQKTINIISVLCVRLQCIK